MEIEIPLLDDDNIMEELEIRYESIFALEKELRDFPKKVAKYHRWAAEATKNMDSLALELEVVTAEVIATICKQAEENGKPIPPSARGEIRRGQVPLFPKYRSVKMRYIEATKTANILNGLVSAWAARGFRLKELAHLSDRLLFNEPRVYKTEHRNAGKGVENQLAEAENALNFD